MNRIRYIYDIVEYLTANSEPKKLKEITRYLESLYDEVIPERRVKQYLQDIQTNFNALENVKGQHGGYKLSKRSKDSIIKTMLRGLSEKDRNAINDAFEVAEKSSAYLYNSDLQKAKGLFYQQENLKDDDFEFYIGRPSNDNKFIYEIKDAMKNNNKAEIVSKYDYYQIKKGKAIFDPLFLLHHQSETYLVLRNDNQEIRYQNLNNIKSFKTLDKKFVRFGVEEKNWKSHINGFTIKSQEEITIELSDVKERAEAFTYIWNHELTAVEKGNKIIVTFYERHKAAQFLFIVSDNCKWSTTNKDFKEYFNNKIDSLQKR